MNEQLLTIIDRLLTEKEQVLIAIDGPCTAGKTTLAGQLQEKYGCTVNIHMNSGYPAVMNPEDLYDRVAKTIPFTALDEPFMTAEDFSWYQRYVPGMFFFLGLGDTPALHADTFDFDETILLKGADFFEALAEQFV